MADETDIAKEPAGASKKKLAGALDWSHLQGGAPTNQGPVENLTDQAHRAGLPHPNDVDRTTIRGSVLTTEGWLLEESKHSGGHISTAPKETKV